MLTAITTHIKRASRKVSIQCTRCGKWHRVSSWETFDCVCGITYFPEEGAGRVGYLWGEAKGG